MGFMNNNNRTSTNNNRQSHQESTAPWEKYAREDDSIQGWYCNHEHDDYGCDE